MSCDAFGEYYNYPNTTLLQLIAAMLPMGAILGSLSGGMFADKYGRNAASLLAAVLFVCGSIVLTIPLMTATVKSLAPLLVGRAIIGFGAGIAFMSVPAYVCELSAAAYRGAMASSISLAIALGFLFSYVCNWTLLHHNDGWKWSLGIPVIPSMLFALAALNLPESPRWTILRDMSVSVPTGILQMLRTPDDDVSKEVQEIINDVSSTKQYGSVFASRHRKAVIVSILVMMLQVGTGIDIILVYAPQNLKKMIPNQGTTLFWTIFIGVVLVISNLVACFIVDLVGRRALLLLGSMGMFVSLLCASISFTIKDWLEGEGMEGSDAGFGIPAALIVLFSMLYVMFFSLSWGPVAFCIPSELVPSNIRARVVALAAVANWIADYVVVASYLSLIDTVQESGAFAIYAFINLIAFVFVWFGVPETMDLSLENASRSLLQGNHNNTEGSNSVKKPLLGERVEEAASA